MVDGLIAENQRLEGLARLLARLLPQAFGGSGGDALGMELGISSVSAASVGAVQSQVEALFREALDVRGRHAREVAELRRQLREAQLEAQDFRRRAEDLCLELEACRAATTPNEAVQRLEAELLELRAARGAQGGNVAAIVDGAANAGHQGSTTANAPAGAAVASALSAAAFDRAEQTQAQLWQEREAHRKQLALYKRYLPDLVAASGSRGASPSNGGSSQRYSPDARSGRQAAAASQQPAASRPLGPGDAASPATAAMPHSSRPCSSGPSAPQRQAPGGDFMATQGHAGHVLYGSPVDVGASTPRRSSDDAPHTNSASHVGSLDRSRGATAGVSVSTVASDLGVRFQEADTDVAWEGYLERALDDLGGPFEKVYLEVGRSGLAMRRDRGSDENLASWPLSALLDPGAQLAGDAGSRCFQISIQRSFSAGGAVENDEVELWTFRCATHRRAQQWVEEVCRAWRCFGHTTADNGCT
eukprot:TRINITY_DN16625_c0_g2_i1.p1 TRINITY_DN16625_c0_g2~~TRINITY_DN16625_c0_g2_i1.p1  ORF type:complete len:531 (-),score=114.89 TRINITY_DN16625_c0_g2_i1:43-1467(-)